MPKFKRKLKLSSKLSNKFKEFYKAQELCDFTIIAGKESLRCHKVVLAAISPWFEDWFKRDPNCSSLKIPNFSFDQVKSILDFVYIGTFTVKKTSDLNSLFAKAKSIQITMNQEMFEQQSEHIHNTGIPVSPERPRSADLMPPPETPAATSESEVRNTRFEDVFSGEMDDLLPYSQVMRGNKDNESETIEVDNSENMEDLLLPFSQVVPNSASTSTTSSGSKNPFKCDFPGCKHRFPKRRELLNHKYKYHDKKIFRCPVTSCKKKFSRGKMFGDHMVEKHADYIRERHDAVFSDKGNTQETGGSSDSSVVVSKIVKLEYGDDSQDIFKCTTPLNIPNPR